MKIKILQNTWMDLIEKCKKKDRKAQETLYKSYSPLFFALCSRYIADQTAAEDVLIKGFTKIFERISQFNGDGSFEGWMKRIMINESLDHLRKSKRINEEVPLFSGSSSSLAYLPDTNLEEEQLLRIINNLPPGYGTIFNLYAIDGYSHKEIAQQLGISESTSKSQLSRARSLLQKQLQAIEISTERRIGL